MVDFVRRIFEKLCWRSCIIVDWLIMRRWLLLLISGAAVVAIIAYFFGSGERKEHWPTYLLFGIVTLLGFFISYRILHYVRPITNMEEYVRYLTEALKKTAPVEELIILASTPNPGLSDYLTTPPDRRGSHYYQIYKNVLIDKVQQGYNISYRILPWGDKIPQNIEGLDDETPLMRFCSPFIQRLPEHENEYRMELVRLLYDVERVLRPTAPIIESCKGFLVISHDNMGFFGVYDASKGELRIRGVKILESLFLKILRQVCDLIQPLPERGENYCEVIRSSKSTVKEILDDVYTNQFNLYKDLFLIGSRIHSTNLIGKDYRSLTELRILKEDLSSLFVNSRYLIFHLDVGYIFTDFHSNKEVNRVFPIFHENLYLARHLKVSPGDNVLDIGFGSGIFSIVAAKKGAKSVYAIDLNEKTLKYALCSAIINDVDDKINFLIGDTYEPLPNKSLKFDLICTNPPFMPMPDSIQYFLHSKGGPDGIAVIRKIVNSVNSFVSDNGCFQMIAMSLGNGNLNTVVGNLLKDAFDGKRVSIIIKHLKEPLLLSCYTNNLTTKLTQFEFINENNFSAKLKEWEETQKTEGNTHLHYIYVEMNFNKEHSYNNINAYSDTEDLRKELSEKYGFPLGIQWIS